MTDLFASLSGNSRGPRGIPEDVLANWSLPGATVTAKYTHEAVRRAIDGINLPGLGPEIYLQGSYRNSTNIRSASDVDILVEMALPKGTFSTDIEEINWFIAYKNSIALAVRKRFLGAEIKPKCIKLPRTQSTVPADIVPVLKFQIKPIFPELTDSAPDGIRFFVLEENRWIVNYPRQHYQNGVEKNRRTENQYKSTVRMFKSALAAAKVKAPGYFIECLIFNVPDSLFLVGQPSGRSLFLGLEQTSLRQRYFSVVEWLYSADLARFLCQNGRTYLFGPTPEQWTLFQAKTVITSLASLWNNF